MDEARRMAVNFAVLRPVAAAKLSRNLNFNAQWNFDCASASLPRRYAELMGIMINELAFLVGGIGAQTTNKKARASTKNEAG
jgi:hypothetical protein